MNAIINPMIINTASNPGTAEFDVGFVVGAVLISSFSSVDTAPGVGVERALSPAIPSDDGVSTGVGVDVGVVDGADTDVDVAPVPPSGRTGVMCSMRLRDTDVDVAPVPPSAIVDKSVAVAPPEVVNEPLLMVAGIFLYEMSPNSVTSRFTGVEPIPIASNVTSAKMISPLTPYEFDADIQASPIVLFTSCAAI